MSVSTSPAKEEEGTVPLLIVVLSVVDRLMLVSSGHAPEQEGEVSLVSAATPKPHPA